MVKKTKFINNPWIATVVVLIAIIVFVFYENNQKQSPTVSLDAKEGTYDSCKAIRGSALRVKKVEDNFFDYVLVCEYLGITFEKYAPEGVIISWNDSEPRFSDVFQDNKSVYTYQSPHLSETANWYSESVDDSWTLVEAIGGDPIRYKLIANQQNQSLESILQNLKYGDIKVEPDNKISIVINSIPGYRVEDGNITYYLLKHPDTTQVFMYRYSNLKKKEISVYEKIIQSTRYHPYGFGIEPYRVGGVYQDTNYKFRITLPDGWHYHEINSDNAISTTFSATAYNPVTEYYPDHFRLEISITTKPNLKKEEFLKRVSGPPEPGLVRYEPYEEIEINGNKGIKLTLTGDSEVYDKVSYHFWNNIGWQYDLNYRSSGKFRNNAQLTEQAVQAINTFDLLGTN